MINLEAEAAKVVMRRLVATYDLYESVLSEQGEDLNLLFPEEVEMMHGMLKAAAAIPEIISNSTELSEVEVEAIFSDPSVAGETGAEPILLDTEGLNFLLECGRKPIKELRDDLGVFVLGLVEGSG